MNVQKFKRAGTGQTYDLKFEPVNIVTCNVVTEGTATSKTIYMSSPDGADGALLVDGDFATCSSTDAETQPW